MIQSLGTRMLLRLILVVLACTLALVCLTTRGSCAMPQPASRGQA